MFLFVPQVGVSNANSDIGSTERCGGERRSGGVQSILQERAHSGIFRGGGESFISPCRQELQDHAFALQVSKLKTDGQNWRGSTLLSTLSRMQIPAVLCSLMAVNNIQVNDISPWPECSRGSTQGHIAAFSSSILGLILSLGYSLSSFASFFLCPYRFPPGYPVSSHLPKSQSQVD